MADVTKSGSQRCCPVRNADECTNALVAALQAVDPDLDVYEAILRIIAAFVPYGK